MINLKDALVFKMPIPYFVLEKGNVIHIGTTKFIYDDNERIPVKDIYNKFYNGLKIHVKYDIHDDRSQYVEFDIQFIKEDNMVEGVATKK